MPMQLKSTSPSCPSFYDPLKLSRLFCASSQWTTIMALSSLTVLVFLFDTVLLDARPGPFCGWSWASNYSAELITVAVCVLVLTLRGGSGATKQDARGGARQFVSSTSKLSQKRRYLREAGRETVPVSAAARKESGDDSNCHAPSPVAPGNEQAPAGAILARWNIAIDQAAKAGDPDRAEQLFAKILHAGLEPDSISYNSVIHASAKHGDIGRAELWLLKTKASYLANAISYNIVIDTCAKANNAESAEKWLHRMIKDGVPPNVISYATVIHARAKFGDVDLAEGWLRKMIDAGIKPNVVSYNSLIYACGRTGDAENAERWFEELESQELVARVTTYSAVIDACAKSGDVPRAEKWMNKMIASHTSPNVVSYSAMIDACAKAGEPQRAQYWHQRMIDEGVHPNAYSFSAVINACAKSGLVEDAEKWLGEMSNHSVPADVVVYSGLIDACAKSGDADRARAVFDKMRASGIQANVVSYACLARPFGHRGNWQAVESLLEEMIAQGLAMNEYFMYTLLIAYAIAKPRQSHKAEVLFRNASKSGLEMNEHVCAALARAVGRAAADELTRELACCPGQFDSALRRAPRARKPNDSR